MSSVLLPINLDKPRDPIASLLREIAVHNPQYDFYSFSAPLEEELAESEALWSHSHLHKITTLQAVTKSFDLVHIASTTDKNLAAVRLAKLRSLGRCQFIFTANLEIEDDNRYIEVFESSVNLADQQMAVSHVVAAHLKKRFGSPDAQVIPNGFDPVFFDPETVKAFEKKREKVIWIGVIEPRKRPEIFLSIAKALPDVSFEMAGKFSEELPADLKKDLEQQTNITLRGSISRPALRELLGEAAVLLFPSDREGLALSVIESLGMGVSVVGQQATSMPELIRNGENGALFPDSDLKPWVQAIQGELGRSLEEQAERSASIRANACERYSWSSIAKDYGDLYAKVLRKAGN